MSVISLSPSSTTRSRRFGRPAETCALHSGALHANLLHGRRKLVRVLVTEAGQLVPGVNEGPTRWGGVERFDYREFRFRRPDHHREITQRRAAGIDQLLNRLACEEGCQARRVTRRRLIWGIEECSCPREEQFSVVGHRLSTMSRTVLRRFLTASRPSMAPECAPEAQIAIVGKRCPR